jgi:pyrophosphatase PpaX
MSIKAVLFDLDGTLIDTEELILTSFKYATEKVLGRTIPNEDLLNMVGTPLDVQMEQIDTAHAAQLVEVYRAHNRTVHDELVRGFLGVREALDELLGDGYRLAVVTSKRHELAVRGLTCFGLERCFEFLLGSDDTQQHKPDPGPIFEAAARLEVDTGVCVYVGDSPYDMRAARAAGAVAVAALWGMFSHERLQAAGAEYEAATIGELPALIRNVNR